MFKNRLITFAAPLVVATTLGVLWIATISLAEIVVSKAVQRQAAAQASSSALSSVTDLNRAEMACPLYPNNGSWAAHPS
jgi:hypothetical protein